MEKQGKVQNGHVFTNPRAKYFPAVHNLWKNNQKKLDTIRKAMQKSSYFLDDLSFIYEFWKVKKKKKIMKQAYGNGMEGREKYERHLR